ncbi:HNH endonuclease signature motif containing protein [Salinibacter ruber]|uniref:HNH endonuclease signature motif containing protein n=1 Tax=Salinibacter ruber TaxID=146919 RepID=UPI0021689C90|nr:hypothetical protein [Salinibacter ruber]
MVFIKYLSKLIKFIAIAFLVIGLIPVWLPIAILGGAIYIFAFVLRMVFGTKIEGDKEKRKEYKNKNYIPKSSKKWGRYEEYLNSDVWESKRSAVLERADGECEMDGCKKEAKEVHHKRYPKNLGYEELGDLKAVCKECHSKLHPEKPDRYTG